MFAEPHLAIHSAIKFSDSLRHQVYQSSCTSQLCSLDLLQAWHPAPYGDSDSASDAARIESVLVRLQPTTRQEEI
jgi:hypothetical protein